MKYTILIALAVAFFFLSCKSTEKSFTPDTFEGDRLTFGTFGGFAGIENKYVLLSNGQIFKYSKRDNGKEVDRVEKKMVEQIFNNVDQLKLRDKMINDPGNMTYFLQLKGKDESTKWKWGGGTDQPDPSLLLFYKNLWKIAENHAVPKS